MIMLEIFQNKIADQNLKISRKQFESTIKIKSQY